jgi:UDP-2,3-diacylglucosamine hydrolase
VNPHESSSAAGGNLVFIGDVHLDGEDRAFEDFLSFLDRISHSTSRIVLMGDLFNLWIGREETEGPAHRRLIDKLIELRGRGLVIRYIEGNRDYRVGRRHVGSAFDDAGPHGIVERYGEHRIFAIHGDLVNRADRQYRLWRRVSRGSVLWGMYSLIPRRRRMRVVERLEQHMRSTNLDFKQRFPENEVRRYAASCFALGHEAVVLGHFHIEKDLVAPGGRILVLPEWKESRRHLVAEPGGGLAFVDSPC